MSYILTTNEQMVDALVLLMTKWQRMRYSSNYQLLEIFLHLLAEMVDGPVLLMTKWQKMRYPLLKLSVIRNSPSSVHLVAKRMLTSPNTHTHTQNLLAKKILSKKKKSCSQEKASFAEQGHPHLNALGGNDLELGTKAFRKDLKELPRRRRFPNSFIWDIPAKEMPNK